MNNINVKTSQMSGHWQKENEGKFGFFPTSSSVVKMEMDLIDFSEVSKESLLNIADFSGGDGLQLFDMHSYLIEKGLEPRSYYNEISEERFGKAKEDFSFLENFHFLNSDFLYLRCKHKSGMSYSESNFAILRNNPPYMNLERYGVTTRAEDTFFVENARYNIPGGAHIFEVRIGQLISQESLLKKIFFRYENVHIFKFPKEEYKKFQQIVVIGTRKSKNTPDVELAEEMRRRLITEDLLSLDEVSAPVVKLTDKALKAAKDINIFRDGRVSSETLSKGLEMVFDTLLEKEQASDFTKGKIRLETENTPIIEKGIGHQAIELNSGKYNGVWNGVLIEGGSYKAVVVTEEEDGDKHITTETEVIKPYIEITNSRGDVLFKDN